MPALACRPLAAAIAALFTAVSLTGCGTMTGIPSHGGGKRFAIEQRLVSASIRSTLMAIDVSPLKGQRVALVFDMISDEGGGNLAGGRLSLIAGLTSGYLISPVTSANSQFQVFNLVDTGTSFANTIGNQTQNSTTTGQSTTNATSVQNETTNIGATSGASSGTSTTTIQNPAVTTTTSTPAYSTTTDSPAVTTTTTTTPGTITTTNTPGTTTTTTGAVTTTQRTTPETSVQSGTATTTTQSTPALRTTQSTPAITTTQSTPATTTTQSTTSSGSVSTNASTNTSRSTGESHATTNSSQTTNQTGRSTADTTGNTTQNKQVVSPTPSATQTQTRGNDRRASATLQYQGVGEYQNFNVPKSDATLLMGLVRNYLILNGVTPTVPTDPQATAILYVTVDIFGTVRSRFDAYIYNQETVKAETAIEMMAFDRTGKMLMSSRHANNEAKYDEHYFFWMGPFKTEEEVRSGRGLLVNFEKVDGSKPTYDSGVKRTRTEMNNH